jgi:hypothetical protein
VIGDVRVQRPFVVLDGGEFAGAATMLDRVGGNLVSGQCESMGAL